MATVTKTIGTTGRDHSTIGAWAALLDDDPTYDAGDDARGEIYNDTSFDETQDFSGLGHTINLNSAFMTVPVAERHDGTAGTGAVINLTSDNTEFIIRFSAQEVDNTCEWLELTGSATNRVCTGFSNKDGASAIELRVEHCLLYGFFESSGPNHVRAIDASPDKHLKVYANNIIYDITYDGSNNAKVCLGISMGVNNITSQISQNTFHDIRMIRATSTADCFGINYEDDESPLLSQNNIVTSVTHAGSGTVACYSDAAPSNMTVDHNLASDTSASGTGSLDSKTAANQFVSVTGGSEDLHLKSGADAIGAGVDLVTTPSGVQFDIDNFDRDTEAVTWDMGAHQFVAPPAGGGHPTMRRWGGIPGMSLSGGPSWG